MTDTNQLLTINELQEAQYFSDEQKNFLKDYQFSYILRDYYDDSMATDDDCGHSITKIAVVENKGCGNIVNIGTVDITTETHCPITEWTELLGGDEYVTHYISSDISGFPSHYHKTTENMYKDNRKEVFEKLGIIDDARKWYNEKNSTENLNTDEGITKYLDDRFSKHIFCDKCHSLIHSSHWKNHGLMRVHEEINGVEYENEYFDIQCPICGGLKEVDDNKHSELFSFDHDDEDEQKESNSTKEKDNTDGGFGTDNSFGTDGGFGTDNSFGTFKGFGVSEIKPCPICGQIFCVHKYPF